MDASATVEVQGTFCLDFSDGIYDIKSESIGNFFFFFSVPPRFIKIPQDTIAYEKEDVEFSCQAFGKPEPKIQWLKNSETITVNDYLQFVNGYNLKILGLMEMDAGIFQCVASNAAGNVQTAARLTVLKPGKKKKNFFLFPLQQVSRVLEAAVKSSEYLISLDLCFFFIKKMSN